MVAQFDESVWSRERNALREALADGLSDAVEQLAPDATDPLRALSLCTDEDVRTLYVAAYSTSDEAERTAAGRTFEEWGFSPAEWPREHAAAVERVSNELSRLADSRYAVEPDDVLPDDDHLRPWKSELFEDLVGAMSTLREQARVAPDVLLIVTSHDYGEWMFQRIRAGARRLNTPERFAAWSRVYRPI